ncbi:MAG TPA: hypothetical protein VEC93_10630, partial [Anaerolineae bacterium]|nr:hypothetical protein [Anaerolineae bacterium]
IASVTRELAIIESQISNLELFEAEAVSRFYETDELANDPTNWWAPNLPCLVQTVRAAGFPRVEIIGTYNNHSRAILHAYKGPRTAAKMLTEDIIGFIHTPSANTEVSGAVQVSGIAFSKLEPERGVERVTVYLDKLDDPAAELGEAKYGLWRNDITARVGSRYGNVGFEFTWDTAGISPGPHMLYVLVEGQYGWQNIRQPIMVKGIRKFFGQIHQKEIPAGSAKTPTQRNGNQENLALSPQSSGLIEEAHYFGDLSTSMQLKFAELYRLAENIRVFLSTQSRWPLASGMRRAFHNLVIYYVNTLANKQKRFNQDIATTLKQIAVSQHHMGSDIEAMEAEIAALRAEIQALQAKSE